MMSWTKLIKEVTPDTITVNDREELLTMIRNLVELRSVPRQELYNPITPEMDSIMLRMIDELPNGGYVIKTKKLNKTEEFNNLLKEEVDKLLIEIMERDLHNSKS